MAPLRAVLLDADHTFLDTDRAERHALRAALRELSVPYSRALLARYREINHSLWERYRKGEITTDELSSARFCDLLTVLGRDASQGEALGRAYLEALSATVHLQPWTRTALSFVHRRFRTGVVTNGQERVQQARIAAAGLGRLFDTVVTSEGCGFRKPDARIVQEALRRLGATPEEAILVGDDAAADGGAARAAGVSFCWMAPAQAPRPQPPPDYAIASLRDLPALLRRLSPGCSRRTIRMATPS